MDLMDMAVDYARKLSERNMIDELTNICLACFKASPRLLQLKDIMSDPEVLRDVFDVYEDQADQNKIFSFCILAKDTLEEGKDLSTLDKALAYFPSEAQVLYPGDASDPFVAFCRNTYMRHTYPPSVERMRQHYEFDQELAKRIRVERTARVFKKTRV